MWFAFVTLTTRSGYGAGSGTGLVVVISGVWMVVSLIRRSSIRMAGFALEAFNDLLARWGWRATPLEPADLPGVPIAARCVHHRACKWRQPLQARPHQTDSMEDAIAPCGRQKGCKGVILIRPALNSPAPESELRQETGPPFRWRPNLWDSLIPKRGSAWRPMGRGPGQDADAKGPSPVRSADRWIEVNTPSPPKRRRIEGFLNAGSGRGP